MANGPLHIGSDSKAFVDKANQILKLCKKGKRLKKPWLQSDGDLWKRFHESLVAKGPHSFRATWVKGHATAAHIASGVTTQENKAGNDKADEIADKGTLIYGKDILRIAKYL